MAVLSALFFSAALKAGEEDLTVFTLEDCSYVCAFVESKIRAEFVDLHRAQEVFESNWHLGFLVTLDPTRHYFLQVDLDEFRKVGYKAGIRHSFARSVHERLKQRIVEATERAEYWLRQTHDFTLDEEVLREYDAFAADKDDCDERWRKRIKLELLTEKLN